MWVNASFLYGYGVDEDSLRRAVELEEPDEDVPIPFCPSAVNALICAWTGQLNIARRQMAAVRDRCVERGAENDLMAVAGYSTLIEIWRGNFAEAALLAQDTMERAEQVGGSRTIALTVRAAAAAYIGREQDARADAAAALAIAHECGARSNGIVAARVQPSAFSAISVAPAMSPVAAATCLRQRRLRPASRAVETCAVLFQVLDERHRVGVTAHRDHGSTASGMNWRS